MKQANKVLFGEIKLELERGCLTRRQWRKVHCRQIACKVQVAQERMA